MAANDLPWQQQVMQAVVDSNKDDFCNLMTKSQGFYDSKYDSLEKQFHLKIRKDPSGDYTSPLLHVICKSDYFKLRLQEHAAGMYCNLTENVGI